MWHFDSHMYTINVIRFFVTSCVLEWYAKHKLGTHDSVALDVVMFTLHNVKQQIL